MRKTRGWDPSTLFPWSLVVFGLCVTVYQGWDCTLRYLANPLMVEQEFVSIASLPPIQLSICKKFTVVGPEVIAGVYKYDEYNQSIKEYIPLHESIIYPFANSPEEFWQGRREKKSRREKFQLSNFVREIAFWNVTISGWDIIIDEEKSLRNGTSSFDLSFYPYEGNSTLLCYTLRTGLAEFGTKFRIWQAFSVKGNKNPNKPVFLKIVFLQWLHTCIHKMSRPT